MSVTRRCPERAAPAAELVGPGLVAALALLRRAANLDVAATILPVNEPG
jgi:hypothetical protein